MGRDARAPGNGTAEPGPFDRLLDRLLDFLASPNALDDRAAFSVALLAAAGLTGWSRLSRPE